MSNKLGSALRSAASELGRGLWLLLRLYPRRAFAQLFGLFLLVEALILTVITIKHEFHLLDPVVLLFFARKILLDFALIAAVSLALLRLVRRSSWPAFAFVAFYFSLVAVDTGIYWFGNTLFVRHHVHFLTWYALQFFVGAPLLLGVALVLGVLFYTRRTLDRLRPQARWIPALRWAVLLIALHQINPNEYIYSLTTATARLDRHIFRFRNTQLEYATQNSLFNVVNELVLKDYDRPATVAGDLDDQREAVAQLGVPLGPRRYPDLGLQRFNKIVLFAVESLSLELIGAHNPKLGVDTTPYFLSTAPAVQGTFTNYWTAAQPTLPGLTAMFFSHPNFELPPRTGYRNGFPGLLKKAGYQTVFLRSASRFYANENIIFKNMGFERIIAREDFYARPDWRKYVYGWGVEDRKLYEELVSLLRQHRDEKIFITVLGTDTHPPHGQEKYLHLDYPTLPAGFRQAYGPNASRFLKSIHHFDYDFAQLVEILRREGLLGDDTLLIVTADHSCPYNHVLGQIPGYPRTSMERIPLLFVSGQALPEAQTDLLASQLDFAPTLFHLLGLPLPPGWWGHSLFAPGKQNPAIGYDAKMLQVRRKDGREVFNFKDPDKAPAELFRLFSTLLVDGGESD